MYSIAWIHAFSLMEEVCVFCKEFGKKVQPCSRCMVPNYCSSACKEKHWDIHKSDCDKEFDRISQGEPGVCSTVALYKSLLLNNIKLRSFLAAFCYHCSSRGILGHPECRMSRQDSPDGNGTVFVAALLDASSIEPSILGDSIPDHMKMVYSFSVTNEFVNSEAMVFSIKGARRLYLFYQRILDIASSIQLQIYNDKFTPEGLKPGIILAIYLDALGNEKIALI